MVEFRLVMRRFVSGLVIYSQTVAERLGINATDLHVLNLLATSPSMTAGQLAEATGLTSGAVTHILDRLSAERWVRRTTDPEDRRRVLVERLPDPQPVESLFKPLGRRMGQVLCTMPEADRQVVFDFLAACNPLLPLAAADLRSELAADEPGVSGGPGTARSCWRGRRGR